MITASGTVDLNNISFWSNECHLIYSSPHFHPVSQSFLIWTVLLNSSQPAWLFQRKHSWREEIEMALWTKFDYLSGTSFSSTDDCCHGLCLPVPVLQQLPLQDHTKSLLLSRGDVREVQHNLFFVNLFYYTSLVFLRSQYQRKTCGHLLHI